MFLHLGGSKIVLTKDIIGIFDLKLRQNATNKQFLETAPATRFLDATQFMENKSFIVTAKDVSISPIAPLTLSRRRESLFCGGKS